MNVKTELVEVSNTDRITDFEEFMSGLSSAEKVGTYESNWNVFKQPNGVCFYHLKNDESFRDVTMSFKIIVNTNLHLVIHDSNNEADVTELNWILKNAELELWSQFHNILDYYQTEPRIQPITSESYHIQQALDSLEKIESSLEIDSILDPIKHQFSVMLGQPKSFECAESSFGDLKAEVIVDEIKSEIPCEIEENAGEASRDTSEFDYTLETKTRKRKIASSKDANLKKAKERKKPGPKPDQGPKQNAQGETFKCEHCDRFCPSKLALKSHFYKKHVSSYVNNSPINFIPNPAQNGSFCCEICGKVLTSKYLLKDHMLRHDENSRVKCPHCEDRMLPESLKRHVKVRHQGYKPFPW